MRTINRQIAHYAYLAEHIAGSRYSHEIEKTFHPEKTPGRSSPDKLDCKGQTRFRFVPRVSVIAVAAGGIEPASLGNRFEQRRFPLPSLAGEKGHEVFKL